MFNVIELPKFKVGDMVTVHAGNSKSSILYDGQTGYIILINHGAGGGLYALLDIDVLQSGIWFKELTHAIFIDSDYEYC